MGLDDDTIVYASSSIILPSSPSSIALLSSTDFLPIVGDVESNDVFDAVAPLVPIGESPPGLGLALKGLELLVFVFWGVTCSPRATRSPMRSIAYSASVGTSQRRGGILKP